MQTPEEEVAALVAFNVPEEASRLIVTLGQERLKAVQNSGIALDNRTTQAAVIQFAAAALAAGLVIEKDITFGPAFLAALGCLCFVIGSGIAFLGMSACKVHAPGVDPSWWHGALDVENFTDKTARSWAAGLTEKMLAEIRVVDETRASYLNRSLAHGVIGAIFLALAAVAQLWVRST